MVIQFLFGHLRMQKSWVNKEEVEIGRVAIAAFDWVVRGTAPRVLGQSGYAGTTGPASTTQQSHIAAGPQGKVPITSTFDLPSNKIKTSR